MCNCEIKSGKWSSASDKDDKYLNFPMFAGESAVAAAAAAGLDAGEPKQASNGSGAHSLAAAVLLCSAQLAVLIKQMATYPRKGKASKRLVNWAKKNRYTLPMPELLESESEIPEPELSDPKFR
jgi:hypothetical protein